MGGVPTKRHPRSKVGRQRSHLALKKTVISVCSSCGGPNLPHRVCKQCGYYRSSKSQAPNHK